jgi:polyisoprenoid-binding protein YceI
MKRTASLSLALSLALAATAMAATETWTVDPNHTTAQFTARHFGIVPVVGTIPVKKAVVKLPPGSQIPIEVSAELDPSNVDTHNGSRDNDLRSGHYFDVATYPNMTFQSTKITGTDPKHFTIVGDLTMHGQTHPVTLSAGVVGAGKTPRGRSVIAYAATGSIDRTQWGMSFGPIIVGNGIDISLNVEADAP